jgi:hypothetical protein
MFFSHFSYGNEWISVGSNKNGNEYIKQIIKTGIVREYWYRFTWNTGGYSDEIVDIDCNQKMYRRLMGIVFNEDGSYSSSHMYSKNFLPIQFDDFNKTIYEIVCR